MEEKDKTQCPLQREMNRRKFLKDVGKGAVIVAAAPALFPLTGCDGSSGGSSSGGCNGGGGGTSPNVVRISKPALPPSGTATVSVAKKESIQASVQRAIELAGGLSEIGQGDKVIIKPNIVGVAGGARPFTHPEVLRAVIQEIKKRTGAGNITIGEAGFTGGTMSKARRSGLLDVIESEGASFVAWDELSNAEYAEIECDDIQQIRYNIRVPKQLVDGTYDHFINVPMIKNHTWQNAQFTCCIKCFVGTLEIASRRTSGTGHPEWANLAKAVAELNLTTPNITMNIVDAINPVMVGGPQSAVMRTHDADLVIASKDRVAADSMALAALRYYASLDRTINEPYQRISIWEQPQITRAIELNLGRSAENIQCVDDGVDEIDGILAQWT